MDSILKRNNVRVIGQGHRPIVFAHGYGCDQNVWNAMIPAFEKDYRLVLFDYVGAGGSDLSAYSKERYSTLDGYAADVLDICEVLDLNDVIFVGHSVSAMIGVLAANRKPQVFSKLVFLGPSPRYLNDGDYHGGFEPADLEQLFEVMDNNYLGWSQAMAPQIMANPEDPNSVKHLQQRFVPRIRRLLNNLPGLRFYPTTVRISKSYISPPLPYSAQKILLRLSRSANISGSIYPEISWLYSKLPAIAPI
jgi:sigma-B regulation protein RsbQ